MNILLTNHHLIDFTGSEVFSYTISDFLRRKGQKVTVLSKYVDDRLRRYFERIGVDVAANIESLTGDAFDVAHIHHNVMGMEVRRRFPDLPFVFLSHGVLPFLEQNPPVDIGIAHYMAVSEEVRENLVRQGIDENRVEIFRNIVDSGKFFPRTSLPARPSRALILSNKLDPATESTIRSACEHLGIAMTFGGMRFGVVHQDSLPDAINRADIVFTLGRGVIETMMCGRVPIVLDHQGGDGMVTPENLQLLMKRNFSGRTHRRTFTDEELIGEIGLYEPSFGESLRGLALELSDADRQVDRLIGIYGKAVSANIPPLGERSRELIDAFLSTVDTTRYFTNVETTRFRSSVKDDPEENAAVKVDFLLSERLGSLEHPAGDSGNAPDPLRPSRNAYDILIPIYNAYEHLRRCIDSVLRHTQGNHAVYLLDDRSPDSRVLPLLRSYEKADARVHVIESAENRGFIHNTNRGFKLSRNDVVILNSDTEVTGGWLDRMDRCRLSRPEIGIVCPLSNNATILSVPEMNKPNSLPEGMDPDGFSRLIAEVSPRAYPEIPTGVGFCMLITRDTLNRTGFFDPAFGLGYGEENDLCMKARAAGKKVVCCDDAYVYHHGEASFGTVDLIDEKRGINGRLLDKRWPGYMKDVSTFCCRNPFREIQERITAGIREREGGSRPAILHVLHKFGSPGGTELHTRNIIDGLSARFHSTVIYPSSIPDRWVDIAPGEEETGYLRVLELRKESANASDFFLGASGDLSNPHVETVFSDFLRGGDYPVVHFQHFSDWGSLLLPLIAKRQGRKVVISLHDYYLLCPDFNLILPDLNRCGKTMADGADAECVYCLGTKRHHQGGGRPDLLPDYLAKRRQVLKRVVAAADLLIAPSEYVRKRFIQAYGSEIRSRIVTVPHGIEPLKKVQPARRNKIFKVGFLGNASDRKGIFVLLLAAQILKKMKVEVQFEIFGGIPQSLTKLATDLGIVQHGFYRRSDLPRILSPIHLVVMPSICEETFGFTLSESQMLGIPVLASDIGALSERIVEGKTGFLVPPNDAKALATKLIQLQRNPRPLEEVSANLRDCRIKTLEENVEDYARIYTRLIDDAARNPSAIPPIADVRVLAKDRQLEELLSLGEEQFSRGEMRSAQNIFQRILEMEPGNYKALNNLGVVQWQAGDAVSAIHTFQAALGLHPEDPDALVNLAKATFDTRRYDLLNPELLAALKQAQPANPDIARLVDGCSGC